MCAKAKLMCRPIAQEWVQYISHMLGDKIHSDLWGPADPQSYNGSYTMLASQMTIPGG